MTKHTAPPVRAKLTATARAVPLITERVSLKAQIKRLEAEVATIDDALFPLVERAQDEQIAIDGYKASIVRQTQTSTDLEKFVQGLAEAGVKARVIAEARTAATATKDKTPYLKITELKT